MAVKFKGGNISRGESDPQTPGLRSQVQLANPLRSRSCVRLPQQDAELVSDWVLSVRQNVDEGINVGT